MSACTVLILIHDNEVSTSDATTGQIIAEHTLDPANPRVIKRTMLKWHVKRAHHAAWPKLRHPPTTDLAN